MKLIKSLNKVLMVVDEEAVSFFNQNDEIKKERIAIGITMIVVAMANLSYIASMERIFSITAWSLFIVAWIIYLVFNALKHSYPGKLPLSEFMSIKLTKTHQICQIKIHAGQRSLVFKQKMILELRS